MALIPRVLELAAASKGGGAGLSQMQSQLSQATAAEDRQRELVSFLDAKPVEDVLKELDGLAGGRRDARSVDEGGASYASALRALFQASPLTSDQRIRRFCALFQAALRRVVGGSFDSRAAKDTTVVLLMESGDLPAAELPRAVETVLNAAIAGGDRWDAASLDLLPKLLHRASLQPSVPLTPAAAAAGLVAQDVAAGEGEEEEEEEEEEEDGEGAAAPTRGVPGPSYAAAMLSRLLGADWKPSVLTPLASTLRDLRLPAVLLSRALAKLVASLHTLPLDEVPALVYQLLLLASTGQQQLVLRGLLRFVASVEGGAAARDPRLAKEVADMKGG